MTRFGSSSTSSGRAFTLLELIVVMAIITILAAMLIPSISGARESARSASCMSNLKQIGVAMQIYVSENAGYYPWSGVAAPVAGLPDQWDYAISPYLGGSITVRPTVFLCPSRTMKTHGNNISTYSIHQGICPNVATWSGNTPATFTPAALTTLTKASTMWRGSETILVGDAMQLDTMDALPGNTFQDSVGAGAMGVNFARTSATQDTAANTGLDQDGLAAGNRSNLRYRHRNNANALFCDGHVATLKKGTIKEKNVVPGHNPGMY